MSDLLIGDATEDYAEPLSGSPSYQEAWQFTALASGTLNELRFRTRAVANTGVTAVILGIYNDAGDAPDALLDAGTAAGTPPTDTWISVTGLSAPIVAGQKYWLAMLPTGSGVLHYNVAVETGGTAALDAVSSGPALLNPWGTPDPDNAWDGGPLGFQGLGVAETPPHASNLEWHVTGLWYPEATTVDYYGRIVDPTADSYVDALNDQTTGEVTFALHAQDPALLANLMGKAYARFLKVYDSGRLAAWGPYKLGTVDMNAGTCTLNMVDPSLRLSRHVLVRGDLLGQLSAANKDTGTVSVDGVGLRMLRDAAENTAAQTTRGVALLGIADGTDDYAETPFNLMGVKRGDNVFSQQQQLSQSLGPDFEFEPDEDTVGSYCKLNVYEHQGADLSDSIVFHYGTGKQNLENLQVTEGAKYTTHIHVLPRDLTVRFTQANKPASQETGPYVDFDATDYDSKGIDPDKVEDVLRAYGDDYLKAYGRPLVEVVLTLPVDVEGVPRYGVDFHKGDTVGVAGRVMNGDVLLWELPPAPFRIVSVRRKRDGDGIRSEITVVGDMVAAAEDPLSGDEDT